MELQSILDALAVLGWPGFLAFTVLYNVALVPFPYDVFLAAVPLEVGSGHLAFWWLLATLGMVLAGLIGHAIGRWLDPLVRPWLLQKRGYAKCERALRKRGAWAVALSAITPPPFSLVCWAAGLMRISRWQLALAVVVSRGLRNALVLWLAS